ncbi:MAG: hypothetical protein ACJ71R_05675 [Nitrososphaeraceae archaeon]|jgi:hypothetical protein
MIKGSYHNQQDKFIVDSISIYQKIPEIFDKVDCLQRAVAAMCAAYHDFRAEYSEDITEVKRQLHELRSNKVWIPRERV